MIYNRYSSAHGRLYIIPPVFLCAGNERYVKASDKLSEGCCNAAGH